MTSSTELTTILRKYLISQSEIDGQLVRDATTQYGAYLDVNTQDDIFTSITPSDTALFFELTARESHLNVIETEDDLTESIYSANAYRLRVIVYGDASNDVCNKLVARFRTEKIRNALLNEGIYIEDISNIEQVNEFKNMTVWQRNDFNIDFACTFSISQISTDAPYASVELHIN